MSLQIIKTENEVTLKGNLTASNVFQIKRYCTALLEQNKALKINLSGLDRLDVSAAIMLRDLKVAAYSADKFLIVTNGQNEKIAGAFRMLDYQVLQVIA
jgi:ABC-type transporter Mla MlaB component